MTAFDIGMVRSALMHARSLNLSALKESIANHVARDYKTRKVRTHVSNYKLIGYLYDHAEVIDKKHIDEEVQLTIRVHRNNLKQIDAMLKALASKKHAATNLGSLRITVERERLRVKMA